MNVKHNEFILHVASSYPILWIDTCEYQRCINTYANDIIESPIKHSIYAWDMVSGISEYRKGSFENLDPTREEYKDPIAPIDFLKNICNDNEQRKQARKEIKPSVMFVQDYHLFLKSPEIWRSLLNLSPQFSSVAQVFVIVSPIVEIPQEIKRYVSVLDFQLPTKDVIRERLEYIANNMQCEIDEKDKDEIISSGTGLTMNEFDNALYLSLVSNDKKVVPAQIHKQKRQLIRKNSAMDVVKSDYGFERIVGLDNMKDFVKKMVGKPDSKGTLIVGVPGGGKSAFAKALGKETGRLTIDLDIGNLQGGLVGETEQNTKDALQTIDAMEPAILFLDELEKSLSGVSGYSGDSGTSKRQGGQILRWLNDHTSDVYVIATCNNIDELPPEYLRSGRWDVIFFVDLPTAEERDGLVKLYKNIYGLKDKKIPDIEGWTGAEIENLCKLAKNLETSLEDAAKYICPMIKVSREKIDNMINKVNGIAVPASKYTSKISTSVGSNLNRTLAQL